METTTNQAVCKRPVKPITAVDLAKDVIRLLRAKKIKVPADGYASVYLTLNRHIPLGTFVGKSLQKVICLKQWKPCNVCALGALFMAHVDKNNQVQLDGTVSQFNQHRDNVAGPLSAYFSNLQLHLIETVYEQRVAWSDRLRELDGVSGIGLMRNSAITFGEKTSGRRNRIISIMQNIIANNGKFCPPLVSE